MTKRPWLRLGACLLVAIGAGCAREPRPNLILVIVDALRADRLGCYGYERSRTPFLDSLAERGTVFRRAYAAAPWTNPSIASLRTSRYPSQHGVRGLAEPLPDTERTLTERLHEYGYATGGFSANALLARELGYAQGYDAYQAVRALPAPGIPSHLWLSARAREINLLALGWLDTLPVARPPVFLYLQYMETHIPYAPPERLLREAFGGRERPDLVQLNDRYVRGNAEPLDEGLQKDARDVYDASAAAVDEGLRELFGGLEARGLLRDAIVVITADHGEELMDHGHVSHGVALYEESIRVPLIVLLPGGTERVDVDEPVSLIDVAPTLLDLAAIPAPATFEGRSLVPLLADRNWSGRAFGLLDRRGGSRPSFSELQAKPELRVTPHERAVVLGSHKLIAGVGGERELYDLRADPLERQPDALGPEHRAALERALQGFEQRVRGGPPRRPVELEPETKEQLRALGYVQERPRETEGQP